VRIIESKRRQVWCENLKLIRDGLRGRDSGYSQTGHARHQARGDNKVSGSESLSVDLGVPQAEPARGSWENWALCQANKVVRSSRVVVVTIAGYVEGTVVNLFLGPRLQVELDRFKLSQHVHADDRPILTSRGQYLGTLGFLPSIHVE